MIAILHIIHFLQLLYSWAMLRDKRYSLVVLHELEIDQDVVLTSIRV